MPGCPVDEEQDMPAFLLHDRLEDLHELDRKEAGLSGGGEEAEREEAVNAFTVTRHHERPFRVARLRARRDIGERNAIARRHGGQQLAMPRLFEAIEVECFPEQRVA